MRVSGSIWFREVGSTGTWDEWPVSDAVLVNGKLRFSTADRDTKYKVTIDAGGGRYDALNTYSNVPYGAALVVHTWKAGDDNCKVTGIWVDGSTRYDFKIDVDREDQLGGVTGRRCALVKINGLDLARCSIFHCARLPRLRS